MVAMSFPLPRLPFLAIGEVIKSMDIRAILCLSVLSEKSANFVMLSIPKKSLSADITLKNYGFLFELMPYYGFNKHSADILPETGYIKNKEAVFTRSSTCGLYCRSEYSFETVEATRKRFYRISRTFKNLKFYIKFKEGTRKEFAIEMIKFGWENGLSLDYIDFSLQNFPSDSIQELLKGCQEHTSLYIRTKLREGFKYTPPPGGYKFKSLTVHDAHWVNLDDFLQCRDVFLRGGIPNLTNEYFNGLLKKIVNLESRLENFTLNLRNQEPCDFAQIVKGFSQRGYRRIGACDELRFERKDGRKILLSLYTGNYLKMTTF